MPPAATAPKIHIEETTPPSPVISGVPTGIAAFAGVCTAGKINRPARLRSFADFQKKFGRRAPGNELAFAVRQFFLNGGMECHVVRVPDAAGDADWMAALQTLGTIENIGLLALPGVSSAAVIAAAAQWCREHFAFFIPDPPVTFSTPGQISQWLAACGIAHADNVAVYFPWLNLDAGPGKPPRLSAPSGSVAGVFARTDANRGVWRAPAGLDATLNGVISPAAALTDFSSGPFNAAGLNVIRAFPQKGIVVWGARTLAGADGFTSEYKYVSVKRLALFLEASISRGTAWAVFEPNGEPLWANLRGSVGNFLQGLFQQRAFPGTAPRDAFFVKCDRTTMTQTDLDNGRLNILVGFAPLQPAQFVVLRLTRRLG